jgi:hypothetical protein
VVVKADFDHTVRLGWLPSPQSVKVRYGTCRAGAVDVALRTSASVDGVVRRPPRGRLGGLLTERYPDDVALLALRLPPAGVPARP